MSDEESTRSQLQYSGDAADIQQLYGEYNVDGFLSAREAGEQEEGFSLRHRLAQDGVQLNELLSPRIYGILRRVQESVGVEGDFEVYCVRDNDVNAFAHLENAESGAHHVVGITSSALEILDDAEIASLIGHELGHFIFGHNRLLGLLNHDKGTEKITVLPYLGECLFLRWRKKSEISADRIGLLASGSFEASARALIKAGFGLSERNLNLDVDTLLQQIESLKERPEILEAAYRSHPLLPLRLKALRLFADATASDDAGAGLQADAEIDELFGWFRRYPRHPVHEAVMRVVALAGMKIVGIERDVDEEEIRTIIYVLHSFFTDTPEEELVLSPEERDARWKEALEIVRKRGDADDKGFIVSRLADIALADGKLLDEEAGVILETAEALGMPARQAYSTIIGAAQAIGFRVDYQMKDLTRRVRNQLMEAVKLHTGMAGPLADLGDPRGNP